MWSYNEISARYTELDEGFYVPPIDAIGKQSKNNKQARDIVELSTDELNERQWDIARVNDFSRNAFALYRGLIENGWPRELARTVLPVSSYSRMFARTDLHNLMHFITLRLHPHAQREIQVYGQALLDLITPIVPVAVKAYLTNKAFMEDVLSNRQFVTDALVHKEAVKKFLETLNV
jgi:thymidylate synthase (FAD)